MGCPASAGAGPPLVFASLILLLAAPLASIAPATATPVVMDDAGSGRDAPDDFAAAQADPLPLPPGVAYQGFMDGVNDFHDLYAIDGHAGDALVVSASGGFICWSIWAPSGTDLG